MMVWFTPISKVGKAAGKRTQIKVCHRVQPAISRRLEPGMGNLRHPDHRIAHRRSQRIERDGDHCRHVADAKEHHGRQQVNQGRQGLHRVEHKVGRPLQSVANCSQKPIGIARKRPRS